MLVFLPPNRHVIDTGAGAGAGVGADTGVGADADK